MRLRSTAAAGALALVLGVRAVAAADAPPVIVLPFDNVSGVTEAPEQVAGHIRRLAELRGWRVITDDVSPLLERERVRYLDDVEDAPRQKLLEATGAKALVSGTIYTYTASRNPVVALSARLTLADGSVAWSQLTAVSADDTEGLFGLGRSKDAKGLTEAAVRDLMRSFPSGGTAGKKMAGRRRPLLMDGVDAFRVALVDSSRPRRVCVLPFENETPNSDATRIVYDALVLRLAAHTGFQIVGPAELREAARAGKVGSFRGISNDDLAKLGTAIDASLFIRGTIYGFVEAAGRAGDPQVDLEMSMVDLATGDVVWAVQHERRGSDYIGLLLLGAVNSGVGLVDRVVSEVAEAEGKQAPRAARAFIAARTAAAARRRTPAATSELIDPRKGVDKK